MRTFRLSLVGTVILAVLGGPSGAVMAQMDADPEAVYFTATGRSPEVVYGMESEGDRLWSSRDGTWTFEVEASDPRASGTISAFYNADVDIQTGHGIEWGTVRMENAGGVTMPVERSCPKQTPILSPVLADESRRPPCARSMSSVQPTAARSVSR